jgi:hypothetical protein
VLRGQLLVWLLVKPDLIAPPCQVASQQLLLSPFKPLLMRIMQGVVLKL